MTEKGEVAGRQVLGDGFVHADQVAVPAAHAFLDGVDALPAFRWYKRELRSLLALRPGEALLDVGCGAGIEACRIAAEQPGVRVMGLDRTAMLAGAARRAERLGVSVDWLPGEAEAIPLPDGSVDACMTERVLKYLPDPAAGIAEMVRILRPGGRIASFELDMATTVLTGEPRIADAALGAACDKVGEPRMGRKLPGLLRDAGLTGITFRPLAFHMPPELDETILYSTVRAAVEDGLLPRAETTAWLDAQAADGAAGMLTVAWIGWLVAGQLPGTTTVTP